MNSTTETHRVTAQIVSGFVKDGAGGNPAGVVLDADDLLSEQMQEIARKLGMSETAFVSASDTAGFRLDFFTPNRRIAHCGHATIAAFSYLAQLGRVSEGETSKMTVDGPRKIIIRGTESYMEQLAPRYSAPADWAAQGVRLEDVLRALGLSADDLIEDVAPRLVNTGNSFIIVPVRDCDRLAAITPDQSAIETISEALDLIGFYVFAVGTAAADATTRMFAPRYAIPEEAATGMAAGPLACFLYDVMAVRKSRFDIAQGDFMDPPSPSRIYVDLERDAHGTITGLLAGGRGETLREVTVSLD